MAWQGKARYGTETDRRRGKPGAAICGGRAVKIDLEAYKKRIERWAYCQGLRQECGAETLDQILRDLISETSRKQR